MVIARRKTEILFVAASLIALGCSSSDDDPTPTNTGVGTGTGTGSGTSSGGAGGATGGASSGGGGATATGGSSSGGGGATATGGASTGGGGSTATGGSSAGGGSVGGAPAYPPGPYGVEIGDVLPPDYVFYGYGPGAVTPSWVEVRDLYSPDGQQCHALRIITSGYG